MYTQEGLLGGRSRYRVYLQLPPKLKHQRPCGVRSQAASLQLGETCSPAHPASGPAHLSPVLPLWQPHFAQEKSSKPASSGALPATPPGDTAKENQSTLFVF